MFAGLIANAIAGIGSTAQASQVRASAVTPSAGAVDAGGFDSILGQVANDALSTLKTGEAASISALEGKASAQQVVEAMMSAERTLQTALAVRDKVVQAYQEISHMAI
jgi:flagellar hook-basal body complex protein FliE